MLTHMKTTIELPDELFLRAKSHVAASGRQTTLRDLVVAGLESELDRRERPVRVDFHWVSVPGDGIQVEREQAIAMSYELPE